MKTLVIFLIIIAGISLFSFLNNFFQENLPDNFWLVEKEQKASITETITKPSLNSRTDAIPEENIPTEEPKPSISPYIDNVTISSIRKETSNNVSLINLRIRPKQGETINISGWTVKTRKGTVSIPQAMEYYKISYNPKNIIINGNATVYLIGSSSPLGSNKSFRLNKCFGYLAETRNFYPRISKSCPKLKIEQISFLTPYCQDFIIKQSGCRMPNYSAEFKVSTDSTCVSYILDYFTYNGCSKTYFKDENYLKNYWYIYLGKNIIEPLHDTIYIYDEYGLLVDEYTY